MSTCTKPDCDCLEKAEEANGGQPVKNYPCLAATVEDFSQEKASPITVNLNDLFLKPLIGFTIPCLVCDELVCVTGSVARQVICDDCKASLKDVILKHKSGLI
jgi:hypothetical protein